MNDASREGQNGAEEVDRRLPGGVASFTCERVEYTAARRSEAGLLSTDRVFHVKH
jgi:hypothetical protein